MTIIKNTISNYSSNITTFLKSLEKGTIILTDLKALTNLSINSEYNVNVFDINKSNISEKIKKIQKLNNIIIFSTPFDMISMKSYNEIEKIINFFLLFNDKPKISKIEIVY